MVWGPECPVSNFDLGQLPFVQPISGLSSPQDQNGSGLTSSCQQCSISREDRYTPVKETRDDRAQLNIAEQPIGRCAPRNADDIVETNRARPLADVHVNRLGQIVGDEPEERRRCWSGYVALYPETRATLWISARIEGEAHVEMTVQVARILAHEWDWWACLWWWDIGRDLPSGGANLFTCAKRRRDIGHILLINHNCYQRLGN